MGLSKYLIAALSLALGVTLLSRWLAQPAPLPLITLFGG